MTHEEFKNYVIKSFESIENFNENHYVGWQELAKPQSVFLDFDGSDPGIDVKKNIVIFDITTKKQKKFNLDTQETECLKYFNEIFKPNLLKYL